MDIQNLICSYLMTDGEAIILEHQSDEGGYQLQVIDPLLLDVNLNTPSSRGNPVNMGVETNEFGRPLFYHFLDLTVTADHRDGYETADRYTIIPADRVIHIMLSKTGTTFRGVPHLHACVADLSSLRQYQEQGLIRKR